MNSNNQVKIVIRVDKRERYRNFADLISLLPSHISS